jgi:hypothetical protein
VSTDVPILQTPPDVATTKAFLTFKRPLGQTRPQGTRGNFEKVGLPLLHEGFFALLSLFAHVIKQRGISGEIEQAHLAIAIGIEGRI